MEEALMVEQVSFSKKKTILRHPFHSKFQCQSKDSKGLGEVGHTLIYNEQRVRSGVRTNSSKNKLVLTPSFPHR